MMMERCQPYHLLKVLPRTSLQLEFDLSVHLSDILALLAGLSLVLSPVSSVHLFLQQSIEVILRQCYVIHLNHVLAAARFGSVVTATLLIMSI